MEENASISGWDQVEPLNARETEILGLMRGGLSNKEIARKTGLSPETVKWYNKQLFAKLDVGSRTQAIARAVELGLLASPGPAEEGRELRPVHNLPAALTSFVGRAREVAEIEDLLRANRLVVLTGAGGSGKTRLAVEVARKVVGRYRDGVWLVELAQLTDPAQVVAALAVVCGLSSNASDTLDATVRRYLAHKQLLLLMDNFEHLLSAAPFVSGLLAAASQVTVLATSRERLNLYGEWEYAVAPLGLPDLSRREALPALLAYDALRLFLQRAQASRPGLRVGELEAAAAARICVQLDGLPLALELAASQVRLYTLPQLADQLKDNLTTLPQGPRDLPARQRTLPATIDWSHSLLDAEEQLLFARLALLRGATLDAIEAVCAGHGLANVRERLTALVDKNLVVPREGEDGELHFLMLMTIREYAIERLDASGEAGRLRHNLLQFLTGLAERIDRDIRGPRQGYWFARLRAEQQNVRAALEFAFGDGETELGLRLVAALAYFWYYDGKTLADAQHYARLAVQKSAGAPAALEGGVRLVAGRLASTYGDRLEGRELLAQALAIYRRLGDEHNIAWCLICQAISSLGTPQETRAGLALGREGLAYFRRVGDLYGIAQALNILGELARRLGDYKAASDYYEECLRVSQESGERLRVAMQYGNLGLVAYHLNQPDYAEEMGRRGIQLFQEVGDLFGAMSALAAVAGSALLLGAPEKAAQLLGAAQAHLEAMGARYVHGDQYEVDLFVAEARRRLGEPAFQAAWDAGAAMSLQEAIAYALGDEHSARAYRRFK